MHLYLVLVIISLATPIYCIPENFQLELTHVDYGRQLGKPELIDRAARRSQARAKLLSSKCRYPDPPNSGANVPFRPSGELEYVLELSIGTPPRPFPILLDTGSSLIWTQCKPCSKCVKQPSSLFDPSKSSTYSLLPCSDKFCQVLDQGNCSKNHCPYFYSYADQTYSYGSLARDAFTLGTNSEIKVDIAFGCGNKNGGDLNNSSGIAGFSTSATSLVSQLGVPGFSYCMTDDIDKRTFLRFGTQEEIYSGITAPVQTTKFVKPPQGLEGLYAVVMTGVTVGTKRLNIPKSAFSQGIIVDSGTAFTQLPTVAYNKLKKALFSNLKMPPSDTSTLGLDCFSSPSMRPSQVEVPEVTLHFQGIDMKLERDNYIVDMDEEGVLCLSMMKSDSLGIIGNVQQINKQILYDLKNKRLAIAPNQCYKG